METLWNRHRYSYVCFKAFNRHYFIFAAYCDSRGTALVNCSSGDDCIHANFWCDGIEDCADGSDELCSKQRFYNALSIPLQVRESVVAVFWWFVGLSAHTGWDCCQILYTSWDMCDLLLTKSNQCVKGVPWTWNILVGWFWGHWSLGM